MSDYKAAKLAYSSEREALDGSLDYQREGLLLTLEGLDDAAARMAPEREFVVAAWADQARRYPATPLTPSPSWPDASFPRFGPTSGLSSVAST